MNKTEMAKLLTMASAIDNRKIGTETVEAWFMVIGDIEFEIAVEALKTHFNDSSEYLIPNHIRVLATKIEKHRLAMERKIKMDHFLALRQALMDREWQKVIDGDPDADPEKVAALNRGEWKEEWNQEILILEGNNDGQAQA